MLNRTWRPALSVTGADGLPPLEQRRQRAAPADGAEALAAPPADASTPRPRDGAEGDARSDPPYGAKVRFEAEKSSGRLERAGARALAREGDRRGVDRPTSASRACYMGEGGTIPFMGMLGEKFPEAQFLITGVLGPQSNAHGPNEFLHMPTARS